MSDMKQKLAAAKIAYDQARTNLEQARHTYEDGPGKAYAEMKRNIAALKGQLAQYEQAHQDSQKALAAAMKKSNGAKTTQVNDALKSRRDAEDMIEECRALLHQAEENAADMLLAASTAARTYQRDYRIATQRWVEMNTFAALVECGERLCAVMAVQPEGLEPGTFDFATAVGIQQEMPRNVMMAELDRLLSNYEGDTRPYTGELGVCHLGALSKEEIMSPAAIRMASTKALAA